MTYFLTIFLNLQVWPVTELQYPQASSSDTPQIMQIYNAPLKQLQVGRAGKVGILDIELSLDTDANKTVITKQFFQVPLQVQRILHLEKSIPQMAYLYMLSSSGGILQGDRYRINITVKDNAISHITTQGATRIYGMNANYASQTLNITTHPGSYLEYIPDQIIPYKNSRYHQKVNLQVDNSSTLIYAEILTPGRVAMHELFEYDICYLQTCCQDQNQRIKFMENAKIQPKDQPVTKFGILGNYKTVGTVYIMTMKKYLGRLKDMINQDIKQTYDSNTCISFGTSTLPNNSGIVIRILGDKTDDISDIIIRVLQISRKVILNSSSLPIKVRKS